MLNGWLRTEASGTSPQWNGVVSSDCGAVQFIETDHLWVDSQEEAAAAALNAGVDFDCSISVGKAFATLLNATERGLVNRSTIDQAVSRLLRLQLRLGFFDPPEMVTYRSVPMQVVNSPTHRALAVVAAREGIVLLRNHNELLPLNPVKFSRSGSLLVTGPNALLVATGNYNTATDRNVTAWDGISSYVPFATFEPGCLSVTSNDTSFFESALAAARTAEVVVAVMGLDTSVEYEDSTRLSLDLPGVQEQLLQALISTQVPVVVVLMGGSAVALSELSQRAVAAIVWSGYGGEEAGTALADVLFGAYNPGGRLPFTFYQSQDDLPAYHNMSMSAEPFGRTYRYFSGPAPVFRFGEGRSYSKFATTNVSASIVSNSHHHRHANVNVNVNARDQTHAYGRRRRRHTDGDGDMRSALKLLPCDALNVTFSVTNAGPMDGEEVTQVYVRLRGVPVLTPLLSLAGFTRTAVAVGDTVSLSFFLPPRVFAAVDPATHSWRVYAAEADVFVGSTQPHSEMEWFGAQSLHFSIRTTSPVPLSLCSSTSIT